MTFPEPLIHSFQNRLSVCQTYENYFNIIFPCIRRRHGAFNCYAGAWQWQQPQSHHYTPSTEQFGRIQSSKSHQQQSPSKDRRRRANTTTNQLRTCLVLLCILLITFLCICQVLFWTRRQDLESAVETALSLAQEGVANAKQRAQHAMNHAP